METLIILILIAFVVISIAFISASNSKKNNIHINSTKDTHNHPTTHTEEEQRA